MKKSITVSSNQIKSKSKFLKYPSHQISSNNINKQKNSSISLLTSPSNPSKNLKSERVLSPSNQIKEKTVNNKQKYKSIQILSPNNNKKVKLDLELKKSLFDKKRESFAGNKVIKNSKVIQTEPLLTYNNNNKNEISPNKKYSLNKKIMISESKKNNEQFDDNDISEINKDTDRFSELDKDTLNTFRINQKDEILNKGINLNEKNNKKEEFKLNDSISMDDEEKKNLEKQTNLIKNLLRSKNYQNFVRKILNPENIFINDNGKIIKFNLFNEDLYNYEFLDVYFKHHIPFIIMRPRLDIIKRKRTERLKQIQENTLEEISKTSRENESQQYSSISRTQSINESSLNINSNINSNSNRNYSMQITQVRGSLVLTKMPQKTEENTRNKILNIAFNRAKDAARVIRRLEYSYGMRTNIILMKQVYQKNARVIQDWWKNILFFKKNGKEVLKLQAFIRGTMIRKAFKEAKNTYFHQLPFLKEVDKVITRRLMKIYFDKMIEKFGLLKLLNETMPYLNKIKFALERFRNKMAFMRKYHMFYTPKKNKCCYTKEIFDWDMKLKLYKTQACIKFFLMHHNERIIKEQFSNRYNPKLFYMLKYGKNKDKLKKKLKNFRHACLKFKELKLKATLPGNISNKFLFFRYLLRKKIFKDFLNYYNDSLHNKDPIYQQKLKTKILLNRLDKKKNFNALKKAFTNWNIKANYLKEYYKILQLDKLYIVETIFRYQKKYREKIFMLLLRSIQTEQKNKQMKGALNMYNIYNRANGEDHDNNMIKRALQIWKKNAMKIKIENAANVINSNSKIFLRKLYNNKLQKLKACFDIRNKIFKEKIKLWKFNAQKLNRHFNNFRNKIKAVIKTKEKLTCLKKNFNSLLNRKKEYLRKYFNRFKTNTGVRKLVLINVQLCFFDENKEIISRDKYSIMEYVRNTNYVDVDKIKKNIILKKNFDFWKTEKKVRELKRLCGKRINDLCTRAFYLEKLKFLHWHKIVQQQKFEKASRLIQKNYHIYVKNKKKNKDNRMNNNHEKEYNNINNEISEENNINNINNEISEENNINNINSEDNYNNFSDNENEKINKEDNIEENSEK